MTWPSVWYTAITTLGLVLIALTTDDPQTKGMAVGAIAGLSIPPGTAMLGAIPQKIAQSRSSPPRWQSTIRNASDFSGDK